MNVLGFVSTASVEIYNIVQPSCTVFIFISVTQRGNSMRQNVFFSSFTLRKQRIHMINFSIKISPSIFFNVLAFAYRK